MSYLEKYIEERFQRYFVFGENKKNGTVNVTSKDEHVDVSVSKKEADLLVKNRDAVLDMLIKVCYKLNEVDQEAFQTIWYGPEP